MIKPVAVKALDGYRIWVEFSDGVEGEIDLTSLRDRGGVFQTWDDRKSFEDARISDSGNYIWVGELDLCPEPFYFEITGVPIEEADLKSLEPVTHA